MRGRTPLPLLKTEDKMFELLQGQQGSSMTLTVVSPQFPRGHNRFTETRWGDTQNISLDSIVTLLVVDYDFRDRVF